MFDISAISSVSVTDLMKGARNTVDSGDTMADKIRPKSAHVTMFYVAKVKDKLRIFYSYISKDR